MFCYEEVYGETVLVACVSCPYVNLRTLSSATLELFTEEMVVIFKECKLPYYDDPRKLLSNLYYLYRIENLVNACVTQVYLDLQISLLSTTKHAETL
jgi:hypothetical protein